MLSNAGGVKITTPSPSEVASSYETRANLPRQPSSNFRARCSIAATDDMMATATTNPNDAHRKSSNCDRSADTGARSMVNSIGALAMQFASASFGFKKNGAERARTPNNATALIHQTHSPPPVSRHDSEAMEPMQ